MSVSGVGPSVVLVGRPNVGKSTLSNRIAGTRRSIVAPVAGTTRDVVTVPGEWAGRKFTLVDTGEQAQTGARVARATRRLPGPPP